MASPSPPRLIIGLDYGTTFSGISVSRSWVNPSAIELIQSWPSHYLRSKRFCKTPSRIAFPEDNPELVQNELRWGFQVGPTMIAASWTKLLLTDAGPTIGDEDLGWATRVGVSHLPRERLPVDVITDYLRMLYGHLLAFLRDKMAKDPGGWGICLDSIQMQFCLAVPAAWSEISRAELRDAASQAGFGSRAADELCLLTEPEAALMTTLHGRLGNGSEVMVEPGECVVICDCGGGSVDIASYMITSKDPLQYHELVASTGEVVGSTSIDRAFCRFLSMRWGAWLNQESSHLVAPGSSLMNWFEHLKHGYSGTPANYVYRHRLLGSGLPASVSHIELPRNELGEMIETVVRRICALLGRHLREAGVANNQKGIHCKVFLVGGFSQSQYLRQQMATIFEREHHIAVFPLRDPQAAVATGAGFWGHGVSRPFARKTRSNYGVDEQTLDSSGVNRRILWFIGKGRSYVDNETINRNVHLFQRETSVLVKIICIYESKETRPVSLIDAPGTYMIAQIPCDLSVLDLDSFPQVTVNGHKSTVVTCEIRATLGTQDGRIRFQVLCQGEPISDSQDSLEPASPTSDRMSISDD